MPKLVGQERLLPLRLKIVVISLLSLLVTTACSLLRWRPTPTMVCYAPVPPTETPTPFVTCYKMSAQTETPSATPPTSPLPTPTPTASPEARRLLLEGLLAEGRFPQEIVWHLRQWQPRQLNELSEG